MSQYHLVIDGKDKGIICASAWLRLANYTVDLLGVLLVLNAMSMIAASMSGVTIPPFTWNPTIRGFFPGLALRLASGLIYYIVFEGLFGRTPGKFITGTLVVNEKGQRPRLTQIIGRSFARYIPLEALTFLAQEPCGWHDSLAGTFVVKSRGTAAAPSPE